MTATMRVTLPAAVASQPDGRHAGAAHRPFVQGQEALGEVGHRELVGPARALGDQRGPPTGIVEQRPAAPARSASASPGGTSSASWSAAGHGAVAVDVGRHHRRARPPSPRAAPRRTTRRRAPGSTRWWRRAGGPASPPRDTRPSHSTRGTPRPASDAVFGTVADHPQLGVALEAGERVEQHREALAALVAADEEDRRRRATASTGPVARLGTSTPLGRISHSPPNV